VPWRVTEDSNFPFKTSLPPSPYLASKMAQTSFNRILVIAMLAAFLVEDAASFQPSSFCNTPLVSKKSAVSGFKRGGLCGLRMATAKEVVFVDERRAFSRRSIATLTKKAKNFLSSYRDGAPDGALLAPDFQFIGSSPHIGGGQFYCFSIDPYETNRVWFNARMSAHVAQSCSLIFTSEGLVKQFTMHIIDEILESLPFSTKDLLPFPTPIETLSIPISSSIPSTGAQVEQELQQVMCVF